MKGILFTLFNALGFFAWSQANTVELNHSNGNRTIRFNPETPEVILYNSGGTARTQISSSFFQMRTFNNVSTIEMDPDGSANAPYFSLKSSTGSERIYLDASNDDLEAEIRLRSNSQQTFILKGNSADDGARMEFFSPGGTRTVKLISNNVDNGGAELILYNGAGQEKIKMDTWLSGDSRITTDELQIMGGSDLAEHFDPVVDAILAPGMVVSIDENFEGKLRVSNSAYDRKVAGVVSGANGIKPGMMMGQKETIANGDTPIALVGRVYVLADAEYGKICPGDLLTSSDTPGHAMKVKKYRRAQGAIIGKALTGLAGGKGYVLVLVNLH